MKKFIKSKRIWFAFITVFISGVVIGVVGGVGGTLYVGKKMITPGFMQSRLLKHMRRELNLNDEQSKKAEKIIDDMSRQLGEIRKEQYPKIRSIISKTFSDIEKILDEEQKVKLTEIRERVKKFHHSRHGHRNRENNYKEKIDPSYTFDDEDVPLNEEIQYPFKNENEEVQFLLDTLLYLYGY